MERLFATFIVCLMIVAWSCGCQTARRVDPEGIRKQEGFIVDGQTTKQDVQGRFGPAQSVYDHGSVLIYHVNLDDQGHISLRQRSKGSCDAYVLVFDRGNVLERHSLVKNGCR